MNQERTRRAFRSAIDDRPDPLPRLISRYSSRPEPRGEDALPQHEEDHPMEPVELDTDAMDDQLGDMDPGMDSGPDAEMDAMDADPGLPEIVCLRSEMKDEEAVFGKTVLALRASGNSVEDFISEVFDASARDLLVENFMEVVRRFVSIRLV